MVEPVHIAWLAGILDGEGSFRIYRQRSPLGDLRYYSQVHVVNTDLRLIREVSRIFDELGISYYTRTMNCEKWRKNPEKNSPCYQVRVAKISMQRKLLEISRPYLIAKADQAWIIMQFLEGTLDGHHRGGKHRTRNRERDAVLYNQQEFGKHPRKVM